MTHLCHARFTISAAQNWTTAHFAVRGFLPKNCGAEARTAAMRRGDFIMGNRRIYLEISSFILVHYGEVEHGRAQDDRRTRNG
jgi:hypothetical protein